MDLIAIIRELIELSGHQELTTGAITIEANGMKEMIYDRNPSWVSLILASEEVNLWFCG
jgi:hypothetical protein